MVQWLIGALLLLVLALDVMDGVVLLRWDRALARMEADASVGGSLLRWYAEGAMEPTRRTYLLLWGTMVLTLLTLLGEQPGWLIAAAAVLGTVTWLEWRFGSRKLQQHRRHALRRLSF